MKFKYNDCDLELKEELCLDKMEMEVDVKNYEETLRNINVFDYSVSLGRKNDVDLLKLNVGKNSSGFNVGATAEEVLEEIDLLENIDVVVKKNYGIEFCLTIPVMFDPMKDNRMWLAIGKMLAIEKFKTSNISIDNREVPREFIDLIRGKIVGMKGYNGNGLTLKIYDKSFEKKYKGKLELVEGIYLMRMEIGMSVRAMNRAGFDDLKDTTGIKKLFRRYLRSMLAQAGKKSRWNKNIRESIEKFECLLDK